MVNITFISYPGYYPASVFVFFRLLSRLVDEVFSLKLLNYGF